MGGPIQRGMAVHDEEAVVARIVQPSGADPDEVGFLLILHRHAGADARMDDVVASAPVRAWLQELVDGLAAQATGSATRVARALILTEPPHMDKGEITDKGSLNQRAMLKHRTALVEALHAGTAPHIAIPQKKGS